MLNHSGISSSSSISKGVFAAVCDVEETVLIPVLLIDLTHACAEIKYDVLVKSAKEFVLYSIFSILVLGYGNKLHKTV